MKMNPVITIGYITSRIDPRFAWFAASLARELRAVSELAIEDVQVIVVDARLWRDETARRAELSAAVSSRFPFDHVSPKPSVWQGPHRLTAQDWFCAATARNTILALARAQHVAFVDDLSVLVSGWLKAHLHAAANRYVLAGCTNKRSNVVVDFDGGYRCDPFAGDDSRFGLFRGPDDYAPCAGSQLYGGTFSVPLESALAVNGVDEIHDGIAGGEDYDFGIRLERLGSTIRICRTCVTVEDGPAHQSENVRLANLQQWIKCVDMWWDLSHPEARDYQRAETGWANVRGVRASDAIGDRLRRETTRVWSVGNNFNLRELREKMLRGESFPIPTEPTQRWVDGLSLVKIGA
jgi:hypothetical protein